MPAGLVPLASLKTVASSSQLWDEQSSFVGTMIETAGYGCHLALYVLCFKLLLRANNGKVAWWYLIYITSLLALNSVTNATNVALHSCMFVNYRGGSGGPLEFQATNLSKQLTEAGFITYVLGLWLQDGLLLYRFFIIFDSKFLPTIIPLAAYLSTIATSCVFLFELSQPLATINSTLSATFATVFWSLSIALNMALTAAICIRLLIQRRRIRGFSDAPYGSISAMLVESAALYTVVAIIFLATFLRHSNVQVFALGVLAPAQCIAPMLIVYRVGNGQAIQRSNVNSTFGPFMLSPVESVDEGASVRSVERRSINDDSRTWEGPVESKTSLGKRRSRDSDDNKEEIREKCGVVEITRHLEKPDDDKEGMVFSKSSS